MILKKNHLITCSTSPNKVYACASPEQYYSPIYAVTRGVNELYVYGGLILSTQLFDVNMFLYDLETFSGNVIGYNIL
jgi:hypothetical protein